MSITYYWNNKPEEEYHINMWTNRICTEKLLKEEVSKPTHIFFVPAPHDNDNVFDSVNKIIGQNNKIIIWYLDHNLYDEYYDSKILELYNLGEDIIKITPDMNIENKHPFKILHTYSMADTVLEQQQNDRNIITGLFKRSERWGRHKYFLCFNGTPKSHRIGFVNGLYNNNLFDKMDISFLSWFDENNIRFTAEDIKNHMLGAYDKIELPEEIYPMHLDFGRHAHGFGTSLLNLPLYFSSYFDIITMAKYEQVGVYLDEKLYKSFACMKPFLIVGQYNTLKVLRDYGFKTFGDWIDESYDDVKNDYDRMEMVTDVVKELNNMSVFEIDKLFWKFKDVLVHNFLHLKKFINEIDAKLIKEICE